MKPKYPKTYHLPFSPGVKSDDKIIKWLDNFINKKIVVTEKLDGSNCCLSDKVYARSHSGKAEHISFDLVKLWWNTNKWKIPDDLILYGENMFAKHSLFYNDLPHVFFLFNILKNNTWISWDNIKDICQEFGIPIVPIIDELVFTSIDDIHEYIKEKMKEPSSFGEEKEGIVIRSYDSFEFDHFNINVVKYVRENHVQTGEHWKNQKLIPNIINNDIFHVDK